MDIVIYGLINAATFTLLALGFSLIYGVSRVANFAHGAVYILTGFVVWAFLKAGLNYPLAVILAVGVSSLVGIGIYQGILIRVRGIAASEVIASFAVGMGIIELIKMVGFVGSFGNPIFVRGSVEIAGVPVDYQRLFVVGTAIAAILFVFILTRYTKAGLALRGIAQDEHAAMMLGINSDRSATVSLAIGSGLAGVAAVVLLPLGDLYAGIGYEALTYAVAVSIVGGLGSLGGTVLASLILPAGADGAAVGRAVAHAGDLSGDPGHFSIQAFRFLRPAERIGRKGVIWRQSCRTAGKNGGRG